MVWSSVIGLVVMLIGLIVVIKWTSWQMNKYITYACFATPLSLGASIGVYYLSYASLTHYKEIWNMTIQSVIFYEEWTEEHESCTRDEDGHETCTTSYIHHEEEWTALDEYGQEHAISRSDFDMWKNVWQNVTEEDLFHMDQTLTSRLSGEGDRWLSNWPGSFETMLPWSLVHTYTNKLRATHTVFDYSNVDEATRKLWTRPADAGKTSPIIAYGNVSFQPDEEMYLRRLNAIWGPKYEIHTMLLLFDTRQFPDRSVMETVLNAWKGPNKNELVVFLGVGPDRKLVWCDVASWMDDTSIHSLVRQDIMSQGTLDVASIAEVYKKRIPEKWRRKEFKDFDYVQVTIPTISYLWMLLASITGVGLGAIATEFAQEYYQSRYGYRYSYR